MLYLLFKADSIVCLCVVYYTFYCDCFSLALVVVIVVLLAWCLVDCWFGLIGVGLVLDGWFDLIWFACCCGC